MKNKIIFTIGSVAIVAAVGFGAYALLAKDGAIKNNPDTLISSSQSTPAPTAAPTVAVQEPPASSSPYKNGTYSATANYTVKRGQNNIKISVAINNSKITGIEASHSIADPESREWTDSFDSGLNAVIVGKSIEDTSYSRIGGASLTTNGFNQALESIRVAAQS